MNDENNKFTNLFNSKKLFFEKILLRTIKSLHYKKSLELFSQNDLKICMTNISSIQKLIDGCNNINDLQQINNKISAIFKDYGTEKLHDLTTVCYGANVFQDCSKFDFLCDYFLPLNYCVVKMTEKFNNESLDCIDIENIESSKNALLLKVHGLRVCFQDKKEKKCIIVSGILHDIPPIILNSPFISNKLNEFKTIYTIWKEDVFIDLYLYEKTETEQINQGHRHFYNMVKDEAFPFKKINFRNREFNCIAKPEVWLERYYGKDWRIPK